MPGLKESEKINSESRNSCSNPVRALSPDRVTTRDMFFSCLCMVGRHSIVARAAEPNEMKGCAQSLDLDS
ncbi:MAG: hypothetical protein MRJ65_01555 [Candidatus Brocadiaceae bacterium]|nr:hypothetical protein [Candidatus Brocadiaceae bacterium]